MRKAATNWVLHCLLIGCVHLLVVAPIPAAGWGETLIPTGSVWKYFDQGMDLGTEWRNASFDDSGWAAGTAPLGYGNGNEATVVSFGPNRNDKFITTYFRHTFVLDDPPNTETMLMSILVDDGLVAYLNGIELARYNMPPVSDFSTLATAAVGGLNETDYDLTSLANLLVAGENLLAVEVHQVSPSSSDMSFDMGQMGLRITTAAIPGPSCDFNSDTLCNVADIDLMSGIGDLAKGVSVPPADPDFDLDSNDVIDTSDVDQWLAAAASQNGFGEPYSSGDADLDGVVDATDLNALALNWRQSVVTWSGGDFTGNGSVDAADLNELALKWRSSIPLAAAAHNVPEPTTAVLLVFGVVCLMSRRRVR